MVTSKEIGVGIIGYSIGRAHAHAWSSLSEYYHPIEVRPKLVAISGRTKGKVDLEARKYGFKRTYYDWKKLVRDPDVNVVDDCAPPVAHLEPIIMAAELGK